MGAFNEMLDIVVEGEKGRHGKFLAAHSSWLSRSSNSNPNIEVTKLAMFILL
ncbi:hypothetical protein COLO4_16976 [Corchorus olitorius]|uniref:Uncharacterized protein n=1 Tax=Corchorus olitorius TaxID=93759 RepID=A0A1R3JEV2_9ROSI|nr:hypothetical protein COLO4_16976 [Corchorus olitorius]